MRAIAYNEEMLNRLTFDMYEKLREYGSLSVDYSKPSKDKTLNQLGFIFGALIDSVIEFYKNQGEVWSIDDAKENFYQACAYVDERLKKKITRFNGEKYEVPKRLSEMNFEEASLFIEKSLYLIDHARCFSGLILHPSIRYTWVRHITQTDLYNLKFAELPRRDNEYLSFLRGQACLWCGRTQQIQAHHLKSAGETGTAYKADDYLTIPLCVECHNKYHTQGKDGFMQAMEWITKYIPLEDFCKINYQRWRAHK